MIQHKNDKKTVILATAPDRLGEASRFLSRRGWTIKARADLKSFLADIATDKPRYVLMSVEFRHENIAKIRSLVETIYRVKVIDFSEESESEGWERLMTSTGIHKIYGTLTGPAIERVVARLSVEAEKKDREAAENALRHASGGMLGKVLTIGTGVVRKPLAFTSRMTCVQVRTKILSGHFLIAVATDKVLDEILIGSLQSAISALFVTSGFPVPLADSFTVEMRRVEFKTWALATASFTEYGVHDGLEVAIAFFPTDETVFHLEDSSDERMGVISLEEIAAESKVSFEIYLHLPLNGKFMLYVARGGWMSLQQQLNLQARGIPKLYVLKKESALLFRSRTHRKFDRMIAHFYENQAPGNAA